ncbi:DUF4956 domain-containing protein [Nocardioides sp. B-3]|uniref:DUF4956 domain-containing protein n=1 Tax=Nocardioides sp. B-3 TaxID=2895565 RepID=UPI0021531143|nr:DUF4956 domain-containing protein [Nocardioides sp. B-3]UUZ60090.1 DUF4956 domain-containing protein [Nocardioides sp. B-3]
MTTILLVAFDALAISVLAYGIYFIRHRRRDMLIAYVALNVGIMAVTLVLANATVAAGLGLGLFGVLSIIRLRSNALTQEEVAYYFASLAPGLIAGLQPNPAQVAPLVGSLIVVVMFVADHPRLYALNRQQTVTPDAAIANEAALAHHLDGLLGADIQRFIVVELDLVRDVTIVDVRYRLRPECHELDSLSMAPREVVRGPDEVVSAGGVR